MKSQRFLIRVGLIVICSLHLAATGYSQITPDTPEALAARYNAAIRVRDWATMAQLTHPEAFKQLKEMFGPLVAAEPEKVGMTFFKVRSKEAYDQLSGATVFERLMDYLSQQVPDFAAALAASEMKIVGHVREEPDLAHVVYRMNTKVRDITASKTAVMTLKRDGEGWRALLSGNFEGLATALSRRENAPHKRRPPARQ